MEDKNNIEDFEKLLVSKNLSEAKKLLNEMNEVDIAAFIQELPEDKLMQAFRLLPKSIASDVFVNMDEDVQMRLISSLTNKEASSLIEDMFTDDARDLFDEMPAVMVSKILSNVSSETRSQINKLLKYPDNSAGSLMAMEYIHLKKGLTIKESINRIRKQKEDFVSYDSCFVTDSERKLLGYVTVKDLIINEPDTLIDDVMQECTHAINRKMLSEMAITDKESFANLTKIAKDSLEGKKYAPVVAKAEKAPAKKTTATEKAKTTKKKDESTEKKATKKETTTKKTTKTATKKTTSTTKKDASK